MKLFKKNNGTEPVEVTEGEEEEQKSFGLIEVAGFAIAGLAAIGIAGYKILTNKKSIAAEANPDENLNEGSEPEVSDEAEASEE